MLWRDNNDRDFDILQTILLAPGTGRNGTERFGDWLVGEAGETQGCRYFFKNSVCGKVVSMRIGMGYDVHRLVEGRDLIIGGVKIPYEKGLLGHSDADVLLHAIMDALLGAAALGDIGKAFSGYGSRVQRHFFHQIAGKSGRAAGRKSCVSSKISMRRSLHRHRRCARISIPCGKISRKPC